MVSIIQLIRSLQPPKLSLYLLEVLLHTIVNKDKPKSNLYNRTQPGPVKDELGELILLALVDQFLLFISLFLLLFIVFKLLKLLVLE